ncbi:MAG: metalloregulator ArsR/SmtB family transcription factor [Ectothiorhodospiraceae bacterium]|nr:metalloregulator ArsR/SmtB family transcription factor [Ectothiorhodospiraceae bacterium]
MSEDDVIEALAALSHPIRLRALRLLVDMGPGGLPAGEIAGTLAVPASTLSTHLAQLHRAGLVSARRARRQVRYAVRAPGTRALVEYLVRDCCADRSDLSGYSGPPVGAPPSETAPASAPATVSLLAPRARGRAAAHVGAEAGDGRLHVLFLCSANSARSIFAECLLRRMGGGRFVVHSAGSNPAGAVNPYALEVLRRNHFPVDALRSKSWNEFAMPGAPRLDFVLTVCDRAAAEACPVWPGQPSRAHWAVADPAAADGAQWEQRAAFTRAFAELERRVGAFVGLPLESLGRVKLQRRLEAIGRITLERAAETTGA